MSDYMKCVTVHLYESVCAERNKLEAENFALRKQLVPLTLQLKVRLDKWWNERSTTYEKGKFNCNLSYNNIIEALMTHAEKLREQLAEAKQYGCEMKDCNNSAGEEMERMAGKNSQLREQLAECESRIRSQKINIEIIRSGRDYHIIMRRERELECKQLREQLVTEKKRGDELAAAIVNSEPMDGGRTDVERESDDGTSATDIGYEYYFADDLKSCWRISVAGVDFIAPTLIWQCSARSPNSVRTTCKHYSKERALNIIGGWQKAKEPQPDPREETVVILRKRINELENQNKIISENYESLGEIKIARDYEIEELEKELAECREHAAKAERSE
jgi:hypothetical protein